MKVQGRLLLLFALLAVVMRLHAAERVAGGAELTPDLPPSDRVAAVLERHPSVLAARAGLRYEESNRERLRLGPYEPAIRLGAHQRRDPSVNFNEWDVALERSLRSGDKSRLDGEIGEQGVTQAKFGVGDAMHEAARGLLRAWFAVVREAAAEREWKVQAALLARQAELTRKRAAAGDAPRMEVGLAEASLSQAEGAASLALGRLRAMRAELAALFPAIDAPALLPLPVPQPLGQTEAYFRDRILEHNHELAVARAEVGRRRLMATRARSDRAPDPTVGVRFSSERSGNEKIAGVYVSIPIPGAARAAVAGGAQAQTDVASQREAALQRRVAAEIASVYASAAGAYASWEGASAAARGMLRNADLVARSYSLGEANLPDVITARRLAHEAALAAGVLQVDAAELRYRLLLDAHLLWPLDADEDDEKPTPAGRPRVSR